MRYPGYDGPTGVGTPRSLLAFKSTAPRVAVYPQVQPHGRSSRVGIRVTRVVYGSTIARRSWSWGDGTSSLTSVPVATHTYRRAGSYTIAVTVTDNLGQTGTGYQRVTIK